MEWDHAKRVCEIHIAGIPSQEAHDRFLDEEPLGCSIKPAVAFLAEHRVFGYWPCLVMSGAPGGAG